MIVITGATGQLGRRVVEKLIERVPADRVGVSVRDPAKAADLAARGVRVRRGDFTDPASLQHAFEGARQVLLVSSNAAAHGGDPLAQHRNAIAAARAARVERIVYTSQMAASPTSKFPPARDHAATEAMLGDSGLSWAALRHGFHAASGLTMLAGGLERGAIRAPEDGKIAWTAHADLAEFDAIFLANELGQDGPTPPLTAAEALDFADLAAIASRVLGRPVTRDIVPDGEMQAQMTAHGVPPGVVDIAMGMYRASREGEFAAVDPTLERTLGRRPTRMQAVMAERYGSVPG